MERKKVTIQDVAREAGVSRQTVSRAINDRAEISPETRSRILAIVERDDVANRIQRKLVLPAT